ncbi:hypothetical protein ACWD3I_20220 [Streptomyces sp. NPDC002817]|uniref:hypothetical protein n=1 Tax=Streptomyces sp. NPDC088357 TaxID=3154655 RepID=UPI00343AFD5C
MTELTVRRLSVAARTDEGTDEGTWGPGRLGRLLRGVAEHRLEHVVRAAGLPGGIWCLRRLDVPVRLDPARPDSALEEAWAEALVAALRTALASGSADAVRYAGAWDGLLDLICSVTTGRTARSWAWRQVGLLRAGDPEPDRAPRALLLALLHRYARQAPALVADAAERVGLPALHRALGTDGWQTVAESVRAAACGGVISGGGHSGHGGPLFAGSRAVARTHAEAAPVVALAKALVAASRFATRAGRPGLRPASGTVEAWAVLVVAEADPSVLRRSQAPEVVAAVTHLLGGTPASVVGRRTSGGARPTERTPAKDGADAVLSGGSRHQDPDGGLAPPSVPAAPPAPLVTPLPDDDPEDPGRPTSWAGLLFLLATASAAGIPDTVLADPVFAGRTLPWVLQGVALSLVPTGCADPAVAAFAGTDPDARPPWEREPTATAVERERIDGIAGAWAAVTAAVLEPAEAGREPWEAVGALVRRTGHIRHTPGWTDVRLRVDEIDVRARRAGLDLDPGWVPWLGTVVRFVYV